MANGSMTPSSNNVYPIIEASASGGINTVTINYTLKFYTWGKINWGVNSSSSLIASCDGKTASGKADYAIYKGTSGSGILTIASGSLTIYNVGDGSKSWSIEWKRWNMNVGVGDGKTYTSFSASESGTVSVDPSYTSCSAPTILKVNNSTTLKQNFAPGDSVTVSWSGASGGTNNPIDSYLLQWGYSDGSWGWSKQVDGTSTNISLPGGEGKLIDFQVKAVSSVSSTYDSGFKRVDDFIQTYSKPTMSSPTISQSNGTVTISWSKGTDGINNDISGYYVYYQSKPFSSADYGATTLLSNLLGTNARSYTWSNGTANYYYRFTVVAKGENWSQSDYNWSSSIQLQDTYVAATSPTIFTYSILNVESGQTSPYPSQQIQISWGGATGGTKNGEVINPNGYSIQYNINNGVWENLNDSIPSDTYSLNYTIQPGSNTVNFRIKTKSAGGSTFDSGYVSLNTPITIGTAPPPLATTAQISISQAGGGTASPQLQLNFKVDSPFTIQSNYNKISYYNIYYTSSTSDNISENINNYTLWKRINTIDDIPDTGDPFTNIQWGLYYRFAMIAYGEYNGQAGPIFSNTAQVEAPDGTPAQRIEISGSGTYIDENGLVYAIAGSKNFTMTPTGGVNLQKYQIEYSTYQTFDSSTKIDLNTNGQSFTLTTGTNEVSIFYYIRVWSYLLDGTLVETPLYINEGFADNYNGLVTYKSREELSQKNKYNPIVQIKRAYDYVWDREDSISNGLRLADGELGATYTEGDNRPKLKLGDGKSLFRDLPYLFIIPDNISEIAEIYTPKGVFPKNSDFEINTPTINFFANNNDLTTQMSVKYNTEEEALEFFAE